MISEKIVFTSFWEKIQKLSVCVLHQNSDDQKCSQRAKKPAQF